MENHATVVIVLVLFIRISSWLSWSMSMKKDENTSIVNKVTSIIFINFNHLKIEIIWFSSAITNLVKSHSFSHIFSGSLFWNHPRIWTTSVSEVLVITWYSRMIWRNHPCLLNKINWHIWLKPWQSIWYNNYSLCNFRRQWMRG